MTVTQAAGRLTALQAAARVTLHELQIEADHLSKLCREDKAHDHAMLRWLRGTMKALQAAHDLSLAPPPAPALATRGLQPVPYMDARRDYAPPPPPKPEEPSRS